MIRGKKRPLPMAVGFVPQVTKAKAAFDVNIHNRFDIEVIDARTGNVRQRAKAENVICNQLWTRMFLSSGDRAWNKFIHYGSGTGTPSSSDVSLFSFVGAIANTGTTRVFDALAGVASVRHQIQLAETVAVGVTITEVGIGYHSSASSLCTHAMLKDMNGNIISIEKTDTDILNIYATVFLHWNAGGYDNGSIRIVPYYVNTSQKNYLIDWLFGMDANALESYAGVGSGDWVNSAWSSSPWVLSLNSELKTMRAVLTRRNVSTWNLAGGIVSISVAGTNGSSISIGFKLGGSWFPGTTIIGEPIGTGDGVAKDFKTAFGYAREATLYVDGVQESNVSVDNSPYYADQAGMYFELLNSDGSLSRDYWAPGASGTIGYLTTHTVYNPNYSLGIVSFTKTAIVKVEVSDNFETWTEILTGQTGTVTVPSEYRHYKYWKFSNTSGSQQNLRDFVVAPSKNIHFDTAPPPGAVITADYTSGTIAKDANHVLDFEFTVTVNEKTT